MDDTESAATQEEAQVLALACLTKRWPGTLWRIRERDVVARAFGWVFSIETTTEDAPMEQAQRTPAGLVLVNKRSRQVVATSRPYTAIKFSKAYEVLLARSLANARNWCSTGFPGTKAGLPGIAEEARREGLEDISVAPTSHSI